MMRNSSYKDNACYGKKAGSVVVKWRSSQAGKQKCPDPSYSWQGIGYTAFLFEAHWFLG